MWARLFYEDNLEIAMTRLMQKGQAKPVPVADTAVENFMSHGFRCVDGDEPPETAPVTTELTDAEKETEIESAGKMAYDDAVAKGLTDEEIESAVDAAKAEAKAGVEGEQTAAGDNKDEAKVPTKSE